MKRSMSGASRTHWPVRATSFSARVPASACAASRWVKIGICNEGQGAMQGHLSIVIAGWQWDAGTGHKPVQTAANTYSSAEDASLLCCPAAGLRVQSNASRSLVAICYLGVTQLAPACALAVPHMRIRVTWLAKLLLTPFQVPQLSIPTPVSTGG